MATSARGPSSSARASFSTSEKGAPFTFLIAANCSASTPSFFTRSASLNPRPRDYTDTKWQASVTDDQLKETILKGGQGVGKSPMMPGQPQLADHPEVLDGLVQIIRGFGKHP